ncbi:MAG: serine--tRNA ligase, partial [Pirellula sp.]
MLDRKYVLENVEAVKSNCLQRGASADIDRIVALELQRRAKLAEAEDWNRQANAVSAQIGKVPAQEREEFKEKGRVLRAHKEQAQKDHDALDREIDGLLSRVPNMT